MGGRGQVTSKDLLTAPAMSMSYGEGNCLCSGAPFLALTSFQGLSEVNWSLSTDYHKAELAGPNLLCLWNESKIKTL